MKVEKGLEDIIQIIPVAGLWAIWETVDTEKKDDDQPFIERVICLGLTRAGSIVPLTMDRNGWVDTIQGIDGFVGYLDSKTPPSYTQSEARKFMLEKRLEKRKPLRGRGE